MNVNGLLSAQATRTATQLLVARLSNLSHGQDSERQRQLHAVKVIGEKLGIRSVSLKDNVEKYIQ